MGIDHELRIPLGDDFHACLILDANQGNTIAIHVESIVIGSAAHRPVLDVLAIGA